MLPRWSTANSTMQATHIAVVAHPFARTVILVLPVLLNNTGCARGRPEPVLRLRSSCAYREPAESKDAIDPSGHHPHGGGPLDRSGSSDRSLRSCSAERLERVAIGRGTRGRLPG